MKKILIATDFSLAGNAAANYALRLAYALQQNLEILNVYNIPMAMVSDGTNLPIDKMLDIAEQHAEDNLVALKNKLTETAQLMYDNSLFTPEIRTFALIGSATPGIQSFFDEDEMSYIVMGIKPGERFSGTLSGSTIRKLIRWGNVPIVLVPVDCDMRSPKQVVFVSDFEEEEFIALKTLSDIIRPFHSDLIIFHTRSTSERGHIFIQRESVFLDRVSANVNYPKIFYRFKQRNSIETAIAVLEREMQIDMLVMVHRKHELISEFLGQDNTLRMISRTKIPCVIFP